VLRRELGAAPRPRQPTHRRWTSSSSTVALNSTEAQLSPPSSGASVEKKANERERVGAARGCAAWCGPNEDRSQRVGGGDVSWTGSGHVREPAWTNSRVGVRLSTETRVNSMLANCSQGFPPTRI